MAALFSHKPWSTRIHGILTATRTHAMNLAKFATVYKVMLIIQKRLNGGKERDLDTFIAGGIGGYTVFGDRTPVSLWSGLAGEKSQGRDVEVVPGFGAPSDAEAKGAPSFPYASSIAIVAGDGGENLTEHIARTGND